MLTLVLSAAALVCIPSPVALPPVAASHIPARWQLRPVVRRALVSALGVFAAGLLLGLWSVWWGVAISVGSAALTLRLPEHRTNAHRVEDRARLAVHADLLAACLDAGMSIGAALLALPTGAFGMSPTARSERHDPLDLLDAVAALLMLGADPETAWRPAASHPDLGSMAAAARRSASGGAGCGSHDGTPRVVFPAGLSVPGSGTGGDRSALDAGCFLTLCPNCCPVCSAKGSIAA